MGSRAESAGRTLSRLFGIDERALAAFRVGAAFTILLDLFYRAQDLTAFYTDQGVLPRVAAIELFETADTFRFVDRWSIHMMSGQFWCQLLLLLVATGFAFSMLIGYRTRLSAIASWILLISLHNRNPVVLNSGDTLLRCMLLWSLFLPLGRCWSLDRILRQSTRGPTRIVSAASAAMLLQLAMMYFFSALFKNHEVWLSERSAVYYALNCEAYVGRFGLWLQTMPASFLQALTAATFWLELAGPLIAFLPVATARIRVVVVATFCLFHFSLGVAMTIGLFPLICVVSWLVYLPSEFWDRCENWLASVVRRKPRLSGDSLPASQESGADPVSAGLQGATPFPLSTIPWWPPLDRLRAIMVNGAVAALVLYVALWNVRELDFARYEQLVMPRRYNRLARAAGLDQNWAMFSPIPRTEDGWLVMQGELRDGSEVNLWEFGEPLPYSKPALVSATYHSQRWRKYLDNLTTEPYALHRMYFANWLAWRWNERFAKEDPAREVTRVQIIQRLEITPPPGTPLPEPQSRVLWTWLYE